MRAGGDIVFLGGSRVRGRKFFLARKGDLCERSCRGTREERGILWPSKNFEGSLKFTVYLLFIFIIIVLSFSSLATWGPTCLSGSG